MSAVLYGVRALYRDLTSIVLQRWIRSHGPETGATLNSTDRTSTGRSPIDHVRRWSGLEAASFCISVASIVEAGFSLTRTTPLQKRR